MSTELENAVTEIVEFPTKTVIKPYANTEGLDLASLRYLNESAIKQHALRCSARCRNNKFTRVGQDFIE